MRNKILEIISKTASPEIKVNELILLFNEHILNVFKEATDNDMNHYMQAIWIDFREEKILSDEEEIINKSELIKELEAVESRYNELYDDLHLNKVRMSDLIHLEEEMERLQKLINDEEEVLSDCCTAPIIYHDICSQCKEHI